MTSAQAILAGAIVIAASIFLVNAIHPAEAQRIGPFVMEHHANSTARPGVFRLDTSSGDISYCYVVDDAGGVTCKGTGK